MEEKTLLYKVKAVLTALAILGIGVAWLIVTITVIYMLSLTIAIPLSIGVVSAFLYMLIKIFEKVA
jgi:hypothetical protein